MPNTITVYIDGQAYQAEEGQSILQVAMSNQLDIPHLCYHEDLPIEANCRLCLVESEGKITTSCTLKASEGMKVSTKNEELVEMRQENLRLLLASHVKNCPKCQKKQPCPAFGLMQKYGVTSEEYQRKMLDLAVHKMGSAAEFDPNLCVKCGRCVNICAEIGINFLKIEGKGADAHLTYNQNPKVDCIYCGQCTVHCPVNAIREQSHLEQVEAALLDKDKILIAQMAPSVRTSIGEEFGQEVGLNMEKKMFTALRQLGFEKIFDVNTGADITTMIEAKDLSNRLKKRDAGEATALPMFTSCCPGWVKFLEFYYPDFIDHLTTARSPQIHSGAAYKTWWADKAGVDPSKIVVVSIMPCTSKKYEAEMEKFNFEHKGHKLKPVDFVLTTREMATLLKKNQIDLPSLEESEADTEGEYSGAAAIYGASGGVMESALRTATHILTGEEMPNLELEEVRGMKGIKRATIKIGDKEIKVAVVATARNARNVLEEIKRNKEAYDYVEFMACPGGCIGGGGQPLTSTNAIIKKRIAGLYSIDAKKNRRRAHENKVVREFFSYLTDKPLLAEKILYTSYSAKNKFE
ncbi:MAG: NAD(P)-dependent iron-only hydrogenase catalytic subunit [Candidatus Pacebacteria bacterium GW2011_GWF2_38_9]|nr:MAG: [Fe] hydrogenase subunit HymC, NADH-quinone oxidoreductase subunit G [candidate division TM6 bacterium GW2011_GWF2_28_16]KKQ08931.1 MAG: NAD(P)-dependent iron-only hydrogenase catalytic subunit [Candidatus Pacebacteria bacterium GW2011_GWF1_36_5]KKQ88637.1 MAG: NAD(P)-dependent iron-only hydrogenase catalytic subunit [Candidatus Pacebacteria bacterium GW2011_GWF2_38_9]HAZ73456.1 ferredoxin [Candidatus Paceibacterota bacterium]